ncbi:MAG: MarR family transcriptional regulator [Woeseiaceae bacterium]|nr:MarR family transcriptional regulator [Woeseiaceae bacterium]
MNNDAVDDILEQWSEERPELDTASLGVVIRVMSLYKSFHRQATGALEELNLGLFEYDVLSALRRQGKPYSLPATRLAKETDLSNGAMTNRVDKLELKGFVRRSPDQTDRRGVIVTLTGKGKKIIDDAIQHRLDVADESLDGITKKERKELAKLLRKVRLSSSASRNAGS